MTNGPPAETPETDWTEQRQEIELTDADRDDSDEPAPSESTLEADEADVQEQSIEVPDDEEYPPIGDE